MFYGFFVEEEDFESRDTVNHLLDIILHGFDHIHGQKLRPDTLEKLIRKNKTTPRVVFYVRQY